MQPIALAVLMDDIASINRKKDSSFAMMLEAQSRNWKIYTFDSVDMFHIKGQVFANVRKTFVTDSGNDWYSCEEQELLSLSNVDVIFYAQRPSL